MEISSKRTGEGQLVLSMMVHFVETEETTYGIHMVSVLIQKRYAS